MHRRRLRDIRRAAEDLAGRLPPALAPLARLAFNYRWSWLPGGPRAVRVDRRAAVRGLQVRTRCGLLQERRPRTSPDAAEDEQLLRAAARLEELVAADLDRPPLPSPCRRNASGRLPVRRVRRPRVAAGLLGRPRRARRRSAQGGLRPGAAAGRGRADVPQGLLPPAGRRRRLAARVLGRDRPGAAARGARHRSRPGPADGHGPDRRVRRDGADLARAGRPRAAVPARHRLRRERAARPLDHRPPVRRRPPDAAGPVRAARRRRRAGAARAGLRAGRDPPQRGPRRAGAARAGPRRQRRFAQRRARRAPASGPCSRPTRRSRPATTATRRIRSRRSSGGSRCSWAARHEELVDARQGPGRRPLVAVRRHRGRAADEPRRQRGQPPPRARSRARCGSWLWPDRDLQSVPIGHVTNGVHVPTWIGQPMRELLDRHLGADWQARAADPATWAAGRLDPRRTSCGRPAAGSAPGWSASSPARSIADRCSAATCASTSTRRRGRLTRRS